MNKHEVAVELLNNTFRIYTQGLLKEYLSRMKSIEQNMCNDNELLRLDNCISYISVVGFDIRGWMLFEIPVFYSHCFWNPKSRKAFDLAVWDLGIVIPRYLDSKVNEHDAITIVESIENYDTSVYRNFQRITTSEIS